MMGATITKKTRIMATALSAALLTHDAAAATLTFVNQCDTTINLYDNSKTENIASGGSTTRELTAGFSGMWRHGSNPQATLVEISVAHGKTWFDISVIPPGPGNCKSYEDCKAVTGKTGFNVPLSIVPQTTGSGTCRAITCEHEACPDAYLYPSDDTKVHNCDDSTSMKVVFCPRGSGATTTPRPTSTPAPSPSSTSTGAGASFEGGVVNPFDQVAKVSVSSAPPSASGNSSSSSFPGATLKSSFTYRGKKAGNMKGAYGMITDNKSCAKQTVTVDSPVGPLSEEVSMVFRGPMEIYDIAVFDGSNGGDWKKVSSYCQSSGKTDNMVFLNNKNVDYATGVKSPQGLASADGLKVASTPQTFDGKLIDASSPNTIGGGPGVSTGAEVNIMTTTKCSSDKTCKGYYDDNGYHGWNGGKKMFVTKVKMPSGSTPNRPAIWMLNAQVLRSNQYGCNCRGMGGIGGCGELDIAEVIETNSASDKVSTHYYFYDGSVPAGADNFAARPTNAVTTYITIIDDSGEGMIKVMEIGESDFDFSTSSVSSAQISAWLSAADKNLVQ